MPKRDFNADRAICDVATAGPWRTRPCKCGDCSLHFIDVAYSEGRFSPEDARFIAEARTGWPAALDEIERLHKYAGFLRSVIRCGQSLPDDYDIDTFGKQWTGPSA